MKKVIFIPLVLAAAAVVGFSSCSQEATANNGPGLTDEPDPDITVTPLYIQRVSQFEELQITDTDIVFIGNSLISRGEWNELLKNTNIKNRGISGDTTRGVLERIDIIANGKPAKIFLMAGINDIASGIKNEAILANMTLIITRIRELSPDTEIFIQSILPVGPAFKESISDTIPVINQGYSRIADSNGATFINLYDYFLDSEPGHEKYLNPSLTNDDLHMLGKGYLLWASLLTDYIHPSM